MLALARKSDVAAIPMWIPHSAVVVGFGLIALIAVWQAVSVRKR
jgi:TRAP-type C4-dicarboxylate transport system permease small subunit